MDNLVVLGNAVPDEIRDGRKTVCTVCYSEEHGLVRIYPVPPNSPMKRWNVVSIPLEQTTRDNRQESWKIQGSRDEWPRLGEKIKLRGDLPQAERLPLIRKLYDRHGSGCIHDLNDEYLSLGVIKPTVLRGYMEDRKDVANTIQTTLDSAMQFRTIKNYQKQPRVRYGCEHCRSSSPHDQQILEWGAYEYMRKNRDNLEGCIDALHILDPSYEKYFLVGNLAKHRNSFVVVSVFRFKTS